MPVAGRPGCVARPRCGRFRCLARPRRRSFCGSGSPSARLARAPRRELCKFKLRPGVAVTSLRPHRAAARRKVNSSHLPRVNSFVSPSPSTRVAPNPPFCTSRQEPRPRQSACGAFFLAPTNALASCYILVCEIRCALKAVRIISALAILIRIIFAVEWLSQNRYIDFCCVLL